MIHTTLTEDEIMHLNTLHVANKCNTCANKTRYSMREHCSICQDENIACEKYKNMYDARHLHPNQEVLCHAV